MWLWILPGLLFGALALVFHPLFLSRGNRSLPVGLEGNPRAELESQRDLLLRQLKELEIDEQTGNLDQSELQANRQGLRTDLGQVLEQLDALPPLTTLPNAEIAQTNNTSGIGMAIGSALMVSIAVLSGAIYLLMGSPKEAPPTPPTVSVDQDPQIVAMVEALAERLKNEPDNVEGWLKLGRSYRVMDRTTDSIAAFTHILEQDPNNLEAAEGLAMTEVQSDNPDLFKLGKELFEAIHKEHPNRTEPAWFLGVMAFQEGNAELAISYWKKLRTNLDKKDPARQKVDQALQEAQNLLATTRKPPDKPKR